MATIDVSSIGRRMTGAARGWSKISISAIIFLLDVTNSHENMAVPVNQEAVNAAAKLIMHRLVARSLARDPTLLSRATASLAEMAKRFPGRQFIEDWHELLCQPVEHVRKRLTARDQTMSRLRLSSPFTIAEGVDFTDEHLRRRIRRAAWRVVVRRAHAANGHGAYRRQVAVS